MSVLDDTDSVTLGEVEEFGVEIEKTNEFKEESAEDCDTDDDEEMKENSVHSKEGSSFLNPDLDENISCFKEDVEIMQETEINKQTNTTSLLKTDLLESFNGFKEDNNVVDNMDLKEENEMNNQSNITLMFKSDLDETSNGFTEDKSDFVEENEILKSSNDDADENIQVVDLDRNVPVNGDSKNTLKIVGMDAQVDLSKCVPVTLDSKHTIKLVGTDMQFDLSKCIPVTVDSKNTIKLVGTGTEVDISKCIPINVDTKSEIKLVGMDMKVDLGKTTPPPKKKQKPAKIVGISDPSIFTETCKPTKQKISIIDKKRIIRAYERGEDHQALARQLGIGNIQTVRNIISRYNRTSLISTGKIGGYKKCVISEEVGERLLNYIELNHTATLRVMEDFLYQSCAIKISQVSISKFMKNKFITIKKRENRPHLRNSDHIKEMRIQYVDTMLKEMWCSHQCVYINETSFQLWTPRCAGRNRKGLEIMLEVPYIRGPHMSLAIAITKKGFCHFKVVSGSFDHVQYQVFIRDVSLKTPHGVHYIIHDNASIHNHTIITTSEHKIEYLPPYSSFLNPSETVFKLLKSRLRKQMFNTPRVLEMSNEERRDKLEFYMSQHVEEGLGNFRHDYKDIRTYIPDIYKKLDL